MCSTKPVWRRGGGTRRHGPNNRGGWRLRIAARGPREEQNNNDRYYHRATCVLVVVLYFISYTCKCVIVEGFLILKIPRIISDAHNTRRSPRKYWIPIEFPSRRGGGRGQLRIYTWTNTNNFLPTPTTRYFDRKVPKITLLTRQGCSKMTKHIL